MKHIIVISFAMLLFTLPAMAQQQFAYTITGHVIDEEDKTPLPALTAMLMQPTDSSRVSASTSNDAGRFVVRAPGRGTYILRLSYVGYETYVRRVEVDSLRNQLGTIVLERKIIGVDEVIVEEVQERFRMRGDTTVFNADAYKVNPDASAEDLVTKLPGVVMQDGQVEAQGEQVQRVMVDGREFFGSDPIVALRNLPAEVIKSIEIYDRQSDQAQFTGMSDGNEERTINIVTKDGMNTGRFGKVYGGYGEDERYVSGGNINIFDNDRRVTLIGLSNNVNQQNFAFEDLMGISGGGGGRGGPPRGGRSRGRGGSGFNPQNFLIGQRGGLNNTLSAGVNYSDDVGSKMKLSTSYFFNRMANSNDTFLDRQLFLPGDQTQFYNESTFSTSTNYNHRFNARVEYKFDKNKSLLVRPRFSFQDNRGQSEQTGLNVLDSGSQLNNAFNTASNDNLGYTSSTSILYRHRFEKRGRTISTELNIGLNDRWGDTDQVQITEFFEQNVADQDSTFDQQIDNETASQSYGIDIDITEPLGEHGQLRLSYEPEFARNVSDRFAYVLDIRTGLYTILDPTFSSLFDNTVFRQQGDITYRQDIGERIELQFGIELQDERILGDQTYPIAFDLDRSFFSVLPEFEVEYEIDGKLDLDLDYRTDTNTPSVGQLQNVIDNTNPLFLSTGNPELEPSYSHSIRLRARKGNWREGKMIFGSVYFEHEKNTIGTASILAVRDTTLAQDIVLQQGAQFSFPVNLSDPSINIRSSFGLGTPFPLVKSNLNFRGGTTYRRSPGLINNEVNIATQYGFYGGVTVASNVSEKLDFNLSYRGNYTIASNSFYEQLDENFFRHDADLRFTWLPNGRLLIESSLAYNDYLNLDEELYPTTFIVNAALGYKFMQQNAAELKLVVGDIFNQENGIRRNITELYIEDRRSQVLGRYILLNLSYKFRDFGM